MCGIAGIVDLCGFDPATLVAMTHLVSYRGPNGFGFAYASKNRDARVELIHNASRVPNASRPVVGLGSRRLAILDVTDSGNMPMETEDGSHCVVFNGEIYNYKEIRRELELLGHRFRTRTDTEVILRAYQEWGENCLDRFNGMWSFALWDRTNQRLFCARDRFGVKPFYYAEYKGGFYFASEIKQILLAAPLPRRANPSAVSRFLEWGLLDCAAETFFEHIYQLPGGCCLRLDLSDPLKPVVRRYWELAVKPAVEVDAREAAEEFRVRFEKAVKLRLRSDVPIGIALSGGLDSSAIACEAKKIAPEFQFHTYSACFKDEAINERDYIAAVVANIGGVGHYVYPQGDTFWSLVKTIAYHQDEPLLSTGAFPQWCVMSEARKQGTPVVLGGQGGDELLCGYQKYRYFYFLDLFRKRDPRLLREIVQWGRNGTRFYWTLGNATRYLPAIWRRRFSLAERVGTAEIRRLASSTDAHLGPDKSIAERQKVDLTYSSIPALLHHEDRISMAHSIETRLPFLDYELVEFAVNCHPSLKLRDGWSKWLLRRALADRLPEKIRLRKTKLGFTTPDAQWMQIGLQNGHRGLWQNPKLQMERFLNPRGLARECQRFLRRSPGALGSDSIFRAVSLELWARVHQVS